MDKKLNEAIAARDINKIPLYAKILLEAALSGVIPMPVEHRKHLECSDNIYLDIEMIKRYKEELCQVLSESQ